MPSPNLFHGRLRMLGLHGDYIVSDEEFAAARSVVIVGDISDDVLMTALEHAAVVRQMSEPRWAKIKLAGGAEIDFEQK